MKRYEQAVKLIQNEQYNDAYELLKTLLQEGYQQDDIKWTIGLTSIFLGNPFQAISYWQQLQQPERFQAAEKIKQVKQVLPQYEQLYMSYNEVLDLLQAGHEREAWEKLNELITFEDAIPFEVYEAYVKCALLVDEKSQLQNMLSRAPLYVQQHATIENMQKLATYEEQTEKEKQQLQQKVIALENTQQVIKKKQRGMMTTAISLAITSAALLLLMLLPDNQAKRVSEEEFVQKQDTNIEAKYTAEETVELTALQQKVAQLEQQLAEEHDILEQVGMSMNDALQLQYEAGYKAYRNGELEQAVQALTTSISRNNESYYVDDALYFLIQAKRKLADPQLNDMYEQFLTSTSEPFVNSPYYDDIMLQYAQFCVTNGQMSEAKKWLDKIILNYGNEWTVIEAKQLLVQL